MKADVNKIRRLMDGRVMTGFAGATADAFALLERFEAKLKDYPSNVPRAATELAKEWRTDRVLAAARGDDGRGRRPAHAADHRQRRRGAAERRHFGDRLGRQFRRGGRPALVAHSNLSAVEIVRTSLEIAAGIDVYTNDNIVVEEMALCGMTGRRRLLLCQFAGRYDRESPPK